MAAAAAAAARAEVPHTYANSWESGRQIEARIIKGAVCHEDNLPESEFNAELQAQYAHYITRAPLQDVVCSWADAFDDQDEKSATEGKSKSKRGKSKSRSNDIVLVKPTAEESAASISLAKLDIEYARRLRRTKLRFTATVTKPSDTKITSQLPAIKVSMSAAQCEAAMLAKCATNTCAHWAVPLSMAIVDYRIESKDIKQPFGVQMTTPWVEFGKSAASAPLPHRWFVSDTNETTAKYDGRANQYLDAAAYGPRIGEFHRSEKYSQPQVTYSADRRFVVPENLDILSALLELKRLHSLSDDFDVLQAMGANPHPTDKGRKILPQPDRKTNIAPNLLSYEFTRNFGAQYGGASVPVISQHTCDHSGHITKNGGFWVCDTSLLMYQLGNIQAQFSSRAMVMCIDKGIDFFFVPTDKLEWVRATEPCTLSATVEVVYLSV